MDLRRGILIDAGGYDAFLGKREFLRSNETDPTMFAHESVYFIHTYDSPPTDHHAFQRSFLPRESPSSTQRNFIGPLDGARYNGAIRGLSSNRNLKSNKVGREQRPRSTLVAERLTTAGACPAIREEGKIWSTTPTGGHCAISQL